MFKRICEDKLRQALGWSPAVAILGARQVGKTTLAQQIAALQPDALYLDLEQPQARARIEEPGMFFAANRNRLVVLDEIQNAPELFSVLRGEIDADRRPGRFLILGSASFKLLQQSQSLAGRLVLIDMAPLILPEVMVGFAGIPTLWLRGGFPGSYMALSDGAGASWEGFAVEQICNQLPDGAIASFYRTAAGAELDLLVEIGSRKIAFEVKFSSAPKVTRGFWQACDDVGVDAAYVVAPVQTGWPMKSRGAYSVQVIGPEQLPW